jgi:hypothetical protein
MIAGDDDLVTKLAKWAWRRWKARTPRHAMVPPEAPRPVLQTREERALYAALLLAGDEATTDARIAQLMRVAAVKKRDKRERISLH